MKSIQAYAPFVLLCLSLFSSFYMILSAIYSWHSHPGRQDEVIVTEKKFAPLKSALPPFGYVGYVTEDPEFRIDVIADPAATREFFLAQYALCPRILVNSVRPRFVIANFARKPHLGSAMIRSRYRPSTLKNFGSGVILFQNK